VVRGLVGLHGGTIAIESELGKGTCVTVRLPLDCRRFAVKPDTSAKIQTISRRSGFIEPTDPFNESMVKKIA
jgi:cell cycle sensor histidine kinase DivJ